MSRMDVLRNLLVNRRQQYQLTFPEQSEAAKAVLSDLSKFCRANESCFHEDPRVHAVLEGRREVFLRIIEHLDMDSGDFLDKYSKGQIHE